jgi:hypothetical protein
MLLAFSGYIRERSTVIEAYAERSGDGACTLEVLGGESNAIEGIFAMMKWWCDGVRTGPDYPAETIFCDLYHLRQAALVLQVPKAMIQVIDDRFITASNSLVPTINDMIKIYEDFPEYHNARSEIVSLWTNAHARGSMPLPDNVPVILNEDLAQDLEAATIVKKDSTGMEEIIGRLKETKIDEGYDAESNRKGADRLQDDRFAKRIKTKCDGSDG